MWPLDAKRRVYSPTEKWAWVIWYSLSFVWLCAVVWSFFYFLVDLYGELDGVTYGKSRPVWKTPFPAVTVCSQMKIDPETYNFRSHLYNKSNLDKARLEVLTDASLLCDQHVQVTNVTDGKTQLDNDRDLNQLFYKFMDEVSHSFKHMFHSCRWQKRKINCSLLFRRVITDEGVCYNFNGIDPWRKNSFFSQEQQAKDWDVEGYKEGAGPDPYPRRAVPGGVLGGLQVVLAVKPEKHDPLCKGPIVGFKVQIHNPAETAYFKNGHFVIPLENELILGVEPETVDIGDWMALNWNPCRPHDYFLANFEHYTTRNCHLECLANRTLDDCRCVPYYLPRNKSVKACPGEKKACILNATGEMLKEKHERYSRLNYDWDCKCLPECRIDKYKVETSLSKFLWESKEGVPLKTEQRVSHSQLTVYIKDVWDIDHHIRENERPARDAWVTALTAATGLTFLLINLVVFFIVTSTSSAAPKHEDSEKNNQRTPATSGGGSINAEPGFTFE